MEKSDVIIVGAGAAGLMCARELVKSVNTLTLLEARDRIGGRILTVSDDRFPGPIELGAEFVHGELEVTKQLAKEAGVKLHETDGDLWRSEKGRFIEQEDFIEDVDQVIKKLKKQLTDISVKEFLRKNFPGEKYVKLRKTLTNYVEGYDAADATQASSFALLQELIGEENKQYRVEGGYMSVIDFLGNECAKSSCKFHLETIVKKVEWSKGQVKIVDSNDKTYSAKKVVITVPLAVLQSRSARVGQIQFSPAIPQVKKAINSLGSGSVIKVILNFDEPIWKDSIHASSLVEKSEPGFIFSDAVIPTWWTQLPEKNGVITGWIGGTKAARLTDESDEKLVSLALESLSVILQMPRREIESKLVGSQIHNWSTDKFSRGGYSYETVKSKNAKSIISASVQDTLYFAGEAYYAGPESGTVEAALVSGRETAKKILQ